MKFLNWWMKKQILQKHRYHLSKKQKNSDDLDNYSTPVIALFGALEIAFR